MSTNNDILLLNVGFIIHENIGYTRDFPIEADALHLQPDLDLYQLAGVVRVSRAAQGLLLQSKMSAKVKAACVRCLEEFDQPLEVEFTDLYAFNRSAQTESGLLVPDTGKIQLAPIVRDEMFLAMPINPVCNPDCKGLCPICGESLNLDPDHQHAPQVE